MMKTRVIGLTAIIVLLSAVFALSYSAHSARVRQIRVGVPRELPPFAFKSEEKAGLRGFAVDLSALLLQGVDRSVVFIEGNPARLKELLLTGGVDFVIGITVSKKEESLYSAIQTDIVLARQYFVHSNCVTVTCHQDLPGKILAVVKGTDHLDVDRQREDITFLEVDSELEALEMVDSGRADVYIASSALAARYIIQKHGLKNIKQVGFPVESVPLCIAVRRENPELLTELSMEYGRILENREYEQIRDKWLGRGIQDPLLVNVKRILFLAACVLIATLALLMWNRTLRRRVDQVTSDLQTSERKYRHLIETSPEMICLTSEDGKIILANRLAMQSLGYTEEQIYTLTLCDLVLPGQRTEMERFTETLLTEGLARGEFIFLSKDCRTIYVETVATVIRDSGKNVACFFSRDITERKRLEDELIQSEKLATMGQMAAGLAHEINNPLGILLVNAQEALRRKCGDEEIRQSLEVIERNALRAGKIVENLLTYTRPSTFDPVPVDVVSAFEGALLMLRQSIRKKHITIEKHFPEEPVMLWGDENQIEQLLINLLLNSIEAVDQKGKITILVRQEPSVVPDQVAVEIMDDGIGILEENLPKIFDPFFTASKRKGFGLGLSIAKRIVVRHGGSITAKSQRGFGTQMSMIFPVRQNGGPLNGGQVTDR